VDIEQFYAMANAALGETPAAIHWDFVMAELKNASGLPQTVGLEVAAEDVPPQPADPVLPAEAAPPAAPAGQGTADAPAPAAPSTMTAEPAPAPH
jgi:hypothetical protein